MSAHQWFYRRGADDRAHGPLTARQLIAAVEAGTVTLDHQVSSPTQTRGKWCLARRVRELREAWQRRLAQGQKANPGQGTHAAVQPAAGRAAPCPKHSSSSAAQAAVGSPASPADRVLRVFVSSTFRDMHEEREELVKRVFPQLRKLCEQRGVTWAEVDLRWGITEEETAEGKVLPICLAEIDRCRPYFIGLLGERYGWVPKQIPQELIDRESWLAEHRDKSVTELEILHGVLNNPAMANRACFYLRDPAYVERVAADRRDDLVETDPDRRRKLAALKARVRRSGLAVRENYPDPQTLGGWVLQDLTTAINQQFPPESKPDPLAREAADHEAFARSRLGVYIGRPAYFDRLDRHAAGTGKPLVVLGQSGCGKSALLANWMQRHRQANPGEHMIVHFIGASAYSSDWAAMLRRIMRELDRRFGIGQAIPDQPDALRLAFANWLSMAAARGRVVLVLDALNQLEDRDGAPDLVWLPPEIPAGVRLIVSTLPGRPLDELRRRRWPVLQIEPLEPQERAQLIEQYLAQYTKRLSPARAERIAACPQAANPLYLRALLEELRVFGEHERLDAAIDRYLSAESVAALQQKILERYEQDYERDRPGLVRDAMTLLWAARRGLSESELLELSGTDGQPLPRAHWSPLYLAAEQSLVSRSGLIGFFTITCARLFKTNTSPAKPPAARPTCAWPTGSTVARRMPAESTNSPGSWPRPNPGGSSMIC